MIASLVATAWPIHFFPNDIMDGFRKADIFLINPRAINDKMLSPSRAFQQKVKEPMSKKGIPQSEPIPEPEISPIIEKTSTDFPVHT